MKGDFSRWNFDEKDNFNGVLHQQGRVLLDSDWNARTRITNHWQDQNGRDVIGPGVAAVPAAEPDSFKVQTAEVRTIDSTNQVVLDINPGKVWADGLLSYLSGEEPNPTEPVERVATYLEPPIQEHYNAESPMADGIRDAVILEVWREAINGFQIKDKLIEPALGGPDTTERVHTAAAFRLLRLEAGDNCENIREKLTVEPDPRGKLTVSLQPGSEPEGDCPLVESGGYTGFEHFLYRIEIAKLNDEALAENGPMFKWSRFNGGLVGRGTFEDGKVNIEDNFQAITTSGLSSFYLEVVEYKEESGHYQVTYGAKVTLDSDNRLDLPDDTTDMFFGEPPDSEDAVFFRLWDGIRSIPPDREVLENGIYLEFEMSTDKYYLPGDYWTFQVRANCKNNEDILENEPPHGIVYHRVPLAILHWDGGTGPISGEQIHDCRRIFHPLTDLPGCCTVTVGEGGDFNDIRRALEYLPIEGGKICLFPGVHQVNVTISDRENIQVTGCGKYTILHPDPEHSTEPIFKINGSRNILLEHMTMVTATGTAIKVEDTIDTQKDSRGISIMNNHIFALEHAVEIRVDNVKAGGNEIVIAHNQIGMFDIDEGNTAISSSADDVLIQQNRVVVVPGQTSTGDPRDPEDESMAAYEASTDPIDLYKKDFIHKLAKQTLLYISSASGLSPEALYTLGGIQIAGGSDDVKIVDNLIIGGTGNGVSFGEIVGNNGFIYEVTIERNIIRNMKLSGIGLANYKDFSAENTPTIENLTIYRNIIQNCAWSPEKLERKNAAIGGIALSHCEDVGIVENRIENNGINYKYPICGIYILHGENIDISRNRIVNNGPLVPGVEKDELISGKRGGIFINSCFSFNYRDLKKAPFTDEMLEELGMEREGPAEVSGEFGIPALKVHDNIVTQPLGLALTVIAVGPVSVLNNQFTTRDIDLTANPQSFWGGAVFIFNLGMSQNLWGLAWLTLRNIISAANSGTNSTEMDGQNINFSEYLILSILNTYLSLYFPCGNVMFNNNQTTLELRGKEISSGPNLFRSFDFDIAFSSQFIFSLDDVSFVGNQSDCNFLVDVLFTNTAIFAVSTRISDNRFKEGLIFALFSLLSLALVNTTTYNQGTHCLFSLGVLRTEPPGNAGNIVLFDIPLQRITFCKWLKMRMAELGIW